MSLLLRSYQMSLKTDVYLLTKAVLDIIAISVDLGINNVCVGSAMKVDGTVIGRKFLKMPREEAQLRHVLNLSRKAQYNGARKNKKLWARARGLPSMSLGLADIVQLSCIFQLRLTPTLGQRLFRAIMTKAPSNMPSDLKPLGKRC